MNSQKNRLAKKSVVKETQKTGDIDGWRESEAKYRGFIENLSVMFYAAEPRPPYTTIYISPAFEQLGYPVEDWRKNSDMWIRILHPEDRDWVLKKTEAAMQAGEETEYEYRVIAKNGDVRWVRDRSSFVGDECGNVVCRQGIILDITTLKSPEQELRALFEAMTDVILVLDKNGRYLKIAPTNPSLLYRPSEELIGKTVGELYCAEQAEIFLDFIRGVLETKQTRKLEYMLRIEGRELWFVATVSPMTADTVIVVARDITENKQAEEKLQTGSNLLDGFIEGTPDAVFVKDLDGRYLMMNKAGAGFFDKTVEDYIGRTDYEIYPAELAKRFIETDRQVMESGETSVFEGVVRATDGSLHTHLVKKSTYRNQQGKIIGLIGISHDITVRKRAEEALKISERRYRSLSEGIMHQVWTAQPDGKFNYVNGRALEYFGRASDQIVGEGWQDVVHPEDLPECVKRWTYSLETGKDYHAEFRLRRHDGEYRWHNACATAGLDADGNIVNWYGTNTDINDKKIAEAKLNHNAMHDALTNLPNRIKFMKHLERAVNRAEYNRVFKFAVLFLDLDRFKLINDTLGHSIGDKLLIAIAERLEFCVRPDDIVARLGGDEFTILLNNINEVTDAVRVANRLLEKLSKPFRLDTYEVFTSASIGIIVSDEVRRQPEDFLRDADTAMYRAKESGKSRYEIFDREMQIRNMNLLLLENDLRRAIEQNEFKVFYQPIVELETGEIRELEALIRWQHPQHGLVQPNDFIGIAEETGLIIPIGRWILEEACRQTAEWQKITGGNNSLSISVNLSAKQLLHPDLTAQVGEILAKTTLDPRCLKLEVTESMVMENSDRALSVISDLHRLGISLSTDDFGTGYSSLSYLHRFPFNRLKVDRSFVSKMDSDQKSEAIVRTILLLGQNLNIEVVAEGIETESQLVRLRQLGCRTGQGFLFSKPVDAAAIVRLLRDGLPNEYDPTLFSYGEIAGREVVEVDKIQ